MSRFVRSLAGAIALSCAIAQALAAQHDAQQSIPTFSALRTGVRATDVGSAPAGSASPASSSSVAQRASIQDEATIEARRSQFTTAGAVIGAAAATLWTVKADRRRHDGTGGIFLAVVLPLTGALGATGGAGLGQFVSRLLYPEPSRDWTRY